MCIAMPKAEPDLNMPAGRLKWARMKAGHKSAAAFARKYDCNVPTYRSHENGRSGMNEGYCKGYAQDLLIVFSSRAISPACADSR